MGNEQSYSLLKFGVAEGKWGGSRNCNLRGWIVNYVSLYLTSFLLTVTKLNHQMVYYSHLLANTLQCNSNNKSDASITRIAVTGF